MKTKRQFLVMLCLMLAGMFGLAQAQNPNFTVRVTQPEITEGGGSRPLILQADPFIPWRAVITASIADEGGGVSGEQAAEGIKISPEESGVAGERPTVSISTNPYPFQRIILISFYDMYTGEFLADLTLTQGASTVVYGCTDPNAKNYNPNATVSNGTCEYDNLELSLTIDAPNTVLSCEQPRITLLPKATGFPEGASIRFYWYVNGIEYNSNTLVVTEPGTYMVMASSGTLNATAEIEITGGCEGGGENPNFIVSTTQPEITEGGGNRLLRIQAIPSIIPWKAVISASIADGGGGVSSEQAVEGITISPEESAVAPQATVSIGANRFPFERIIVISFYDMYTGEFLADLTLTQGASTVVHGCTDPNAINYNPDATVSDNSCVYETSLSVAIEASAYALTCEQPQVTLTASATGVPEGQTVSYRWYKNGNPVGTGLSMTVFSAGSYYVTASIGTASATAPIEIVGGCGEGGEKAGFEVTLPRTHFPAEPDYEYFKIVAATLEAENTEWSFEVSPQDGGLMVNPRTGTGSETFARINTNANPSTEERAYTINFISNGIVLHTFNVTQVGATTGSGNDLSVSIEASTYVLTCEQPSIMLTANVTGIPEGMSVTYDWIRDGVSIGGNQYISVVDPGYYEVNVIVDDPTMTMTASDQISIINECGIYIQALQGTVLSCELPSLSLDAKVSGGETETYEWLKDNVRVGTQPSYRVTAAGTYTLRVIDAALGIDVTRQIEITGGCNEKPSVSIDVSDVTNLTCHQPYTTLTAVVTPTGIKAVFEWMKDSMYVGAEQSIVASSAGFYTVNVYEATTMTPIATAYIEITGGCDEKPSVSIDASGVTTLTCNQPQTTLTAVVTSTRIKPVFEWMKDSMYVGAEQSIVASSAGFYTVNVYEATTMIPIATAEIEITGGCIAVPGCTDPYSLSYNPQATIDDGSCTYKTIEEAVEGCTNSESLNYNPIATIDNGSCILPEDTVDMPQPIYGCKDIKALNFNPNATDFDAGREDCQCLYANEENSKLTNIEELDDTPIDVVGVKPIENCQLQVNVPIVRAEIVSMEVLNPTQVKARWEIELEGGEIIITYFATYTVSQSGNTLFYLSIICKGNENRSLSLRAGETAGVTGFTVSALADVDLRGTTDIYQPETSQANSLAVYPNPTTGIVNISQNTEIKVYSPQGILLQEIFGNQVDLSTYPVGIYLLQLDGQSVKVVKK